MVLACNSSPKKAEAPAAAKPKPPPATASVGVTPLAPAMLQSDAAVEAAPAPPKVVIPDDMLLVPGGTFTMGADDVGEQDERPSHKVTVDSFLLDKTEVTNAAYRRCVEAEICRKPRDGVAKAMKYGSDKAFRGPRQPVVGVSWFNAKKYCGWKKKRLPREAEWERAVRGDDQRKYPWGNEPPDKSKHGAFAGAKSGTTVDVGSYPEGRGPYGHFDLAGNVWEWMEDHYDPYAYKRDTRDRGIPGSCDEILKAQDELRREGKQGYTGSNPIPKECERVLRGGAFNYRGAGLRNSNRVHHPGGWRILVAGFRCAKDAIPSRQ